MDATEKHVITQEDLDANPSLAEEEVKIGDEIDLPEATEEDLIASQIHADAIAAGKSDDEAFALVQEYYVKKQAELDASVAGDTLSNNTEAPVEEVSSEESVVEESASFPAPEVKLYAGKRVASFNGVTLALESGEQMPFSQEEYDLLPLA